MNGNMKKVTDKLEELNGFVLQAKWKDDISCMKTEINMDLGVVRQELDVVKKSVIRDERKGLNDDEDFKKLEKEVSILKTELDSKVKKTVIGVKEDVEETLEIERRKMNLVIHGVPEVDAEHDIGAISEILGTGLHMNFDRHVASVMRIGKLYENRPRPIRPVIKSMDGKKQEQRISKRLKNTKECSFHLT